MRIISRLFPVVAAIDVAACTFPATVTPHPGGSNLFARLAGTAPLVDAKGCQTYAEGASKRLDDRLAKEDAARAAP